MKIDKVYIITIDHRDEYYQELYERVRDLPLPEGTPIQIMPGFIGKRLRTEYVPDYRLYPGWDLSYRGNSNFWWTRPVTDGEAGGCISHTLCWEDAYQNGYQRIMILEDDFTIIEPINWDIFEEMKEYEWDLCLLSHNSLHKLYSDVPKPYKISKEYFIRPTYFYNTHSYLLNREGIRKLVEDHLPILKKNVIVSDEFLSAVTSSHPRWDIRQLFISNIIAIATKTNYTGQSRSEGLGNSLTEPENEFE
jgi:GR25 family glycosyltransferase involved in LPS biosynthesis